MIDSFSGKYRFLSNFWPCLIQFEGLYYPSTEAAYQASKILKNGGARLPFSLMNGREAKKAGRKVKINNPEYIENRYGIMLKLNRYKYTENEYLKNQLLDTGDVELIEGNTWGDIYWGVCNGLGENKLGKILMRVREELKNAEE